MKRTDILPTLEKLFTNPPSSIANTYKVCWFGGELTLLSTACSRKPEIIFGVVHKDDLTFGLTSAHWNRIENKIVLFLTQKGLI